MINKALELIDSLSADCQMKLSEIRKELTSNVETEIDIDNVKENCIASLQHAAKPIVGCVCIEVNKKTDKERIVKYIKDKDDWVTAQEISNHLNFEMGNYLSSLFNDLVSNGSIIKSHKGYGIEERE